MLRYRPAPLEKEARNGLAKLQARVNAETSRSAQSKLATTLFKNKNNATFKDVKSKLKDVASIDEACFYCERDRYRDIEHIRPKRFVPSRAFRWSNYIYACTICNQDRKVDKLAIITRDGALVDLPRDYADATPLPKGIPALIHIRHEDPLEFLKLDLTTGIFTVLGSGIKSMRGTYTRDLFELDAPSLRRARKQIYAAILSYLKIMSEALSKEDMDAASRAAREIKLLPYPTVHSELYRQRTEHAGLSELLDALDFCIAS